MKKINKTKIFILLFLVMFVIYPLIEMLIRVKWADFSNLVTSKNFLESLTNSLYVTTISTIISIIIAYFLAFTLNRTNIKHRAILKVMLTLPMLIPSISHGLGLINLFGVNGIVSKNLGFNIIGPVGIIMGSIIYSFPVAFLMLDDGFNYIDNSMYDTAKVLGLNGWQTFKKVTIEINFSNEIDYRIRLYATASQTGKLIEDSLDQENKPNWYLLFSEALISDVGTTTFAPASSLLN